MCLKFILILIVNLAVLTSGDESEDDRPDNRIINGFTPGRFDNPHVVLLFIKLAQGRQVCSGALISNQWVLTAGHCGSGAVSIEVHLGVFSRNAPTPQKINVPATQIFVHPEFVTNENITINDIALIRLNPVANTLLRSIRPISFACPSAGTFAGRPSRTCGWGITSDTATNITNVLQCVDMPIMENSICEEEWVNKNVVSSKNICTRVVAGRTVCHGDSGGPLLVNTGFFPRLKLAGIVSYGDNPCQTATLPNVFTRVSSFRSWISRITKLVFCVNLAVLTSGDESEDDRPDTRIINGFTPGRFDNPHVVLLFIKLALGRQVCTGSLISNQWVVTTGHCGFGAVSIEVHLGVFNRNEPTPQKINVTATEIFVHPEFVTTDTANINDIALIRLNPCANTSLRSIRPIPFVCPSAGTFSGETSRTCGWGITSDTATNITNVLKCIDMPIIKNTECKRRWGNKTVVSSKNICTRVVAGRTTCHGDCGGPLVVNTGFFLIPKLVGAISNGDEPCQRARLPNIFTRISAFSSWISNTTQLLCSWF